MGANLTVWSCITVVALAAVALSLQLNDFGARMTVAASAVASVAGFFITRGTIPVFAPRLKKAGLGGGDLNKVQAEGKPKVVIPESLGVVSGTVFLVCVILFQLTQAWRLTAAANSLAEYNAALTSICFMIFLGFSDDVLDLEWRYKFILPTVASLPLAVAYGGFTGLLVPVPLRSLVGADVIELGPLFYVYMCMLAVFCTNSINILAGINGLEAGQSLVVAIFVLMFNAGMVLTLPADEDGNEGRAHHLFSLSLMGPFIGTTLGLLWYNWYPSSVFVGDTFTYFAGMTFAVAGILGHFPKTLLLFFVPQVLNFVLSLPQLAKVVPCPRHRLPVLIPETGLLRCRHIAESKGIEGKKVSSLWPLPLDRTPNLNLVNITLKLTGPMSEVALCRLLLAFQATCCTAGLALRFWVGSYL